MIRGVIGATGAVSAPTDLWMPAVMAPDLLLSDETVAISSGAGSWWNDYSNPDMNFGQSTLTRVPQFEDAALNGKRVAHFSNDSLQCATAQALNLGRAVSSMSMFLVVKQSVVESSSKVLFGISTGSGNGGRFSVVVTSGNKVALGGRRADGDAYAGLNGVGSVGTDWALIYAEVDWGARTARLVINGVTDATASGFGTAGATSDTPSNYPIRIGTNHDLNSANYVDARYAALMFLRRKLTTDELQRAEGWAAHHYAIQSVLPAGHPYKLSPPLAA